MKSGGREEALDEDVNVEGKRSERGYIAEGRGMTAMTSMEDGTERASAASLIPSLVDGRGTPWIPVYCQAGHSRFRLLVVHLRVVATSLTS